MAPRINLRTPHAALRVTFGDYLVVGGGPCLAEWDDDAWDWPNELPDLGQHEVWWWLAFGGEPLWKRYADLVRVAGWSVNSRVDCMRSAIPDPCSWLMTSPFERNRLEAHFLAKPGLGLEQMLIAATSSGRDIFMSVPTVFARAEGAPAPTSDGFVERHEPMFSSERPTFSLTA